ncbi:monovalent cation/H+ antiporter complex subunit F [Pseudohongiella sp.]|uniref:Multiple resistance and pH regulation protein F n=1 Tax=marine sediment metagenome TaxID=412755 RepID=A0A0F9W6N4_9ZZZZ|nr:monovalent cation/H+ antiporter complex subunit F [Pseudohongiella sp.]HDZ07892.1 portal protein [Pseudohongiella sp.]HEA64501.1 portal protein [Pseudohongiella sp.]
MMWLTSLILLTALAGFWRMAHSSSIADRLLGLQMLSNTGIAFLLLLAQWQHNPIWRDVALVLALLAAVITMAMVQMLRRRV